MLLSLIVGTRLDVQAFLTSGKRFLRTSCKTPTTPNVCIGSETSSPAVATATTSNESFGRLQLSRKPNYYWNNIENVRQALTEFWGNLNVSSFPENLPPIPSEALLNHFERYDLRRVIAKYGGREDLSYDLGGVEIIPGKWKDSVRDSMIVQQLLRNESLGLRADLPPLSPQQKKALNNTVGENLSRDQYRWSYKNKEERRPMKYWSLTQVLENLYEHLDELCETQNRPPVWMPRPVEIRESGREDLFHAIARFGGTKEITEIAGLVPHHEWHYFEGQLTLMKELTRYLDEHHGGNRMVFPTGVEIKERGYMSLYYAVQRYGGRKFLTSRFGMESPGRVSSSYLEMSFGPFSLDFAIDLLEYIRNDHLESKAPMKPATIRMPTEYVLFQRGRSDLIDGIQKYGGYENVARRLGLAYFDADSIVSQLRDRRRRLR
jgi:hypothetical protein